MNDFSRQGEGGSKLNYIGIRFLFRLREDGEVMSKWLHVDESAPSDDIPPIFSFAAWWLCKPATPEADDI